MNVYDAAMRYKDSDTPVIVLAGKEYGSGSSRDWAAKGPFILVSRVVVSTIHVCACYCSMNFWFGDKSMY